MRLGGHFLHSHSRGRSTVATGEQLSAMVGFDVAMCQQGCHTALGATWPVNRQFRVNPITDQWELTMPSAEPNVLLPASWTGSPITDNVAARGALANGCSTQAPVDSVEPFPTSHSHGQVIVSRCDVATQL
jgi:hypothetical protein